MGYPGVIRGIFGIFAKKHKEFQSLKDSALDCTTLENYILECGGGVPNEFWDGNDAAIVTNVLTDIWTIAHDPTFVTLQTISGMGNKQFSEAYNIKLRTIED